MYGRCMKCSYSSSSPHSCSPLPVQHQADYGDIIKTAITHCLRYSVAQTSYEWSHVLVEALKSEYQQLTEEQGGNTTVDFTSASWGDLRVWVHLHTYIRRSHSKQASSFCVIAGCHLDKSIAMLVGLESS